MKHSFEQERLEQIFLMLAEHMGQKEVTSDMRDVLNLHLQVRRR